jgi:hypothetical protein
MEKLRFGNSSPRWLDPKGKVTVSKVTVSQHTDVDEGSK